MEKSCIRIAEDPGCAVVHPMSFELEGGARMWGVSEHAGRR